MTTPTLPKLSVELFYADELKLLDWAESVLAAAPQTQPEPWIPVSERLPVDREDVIFYSPDLRNPTRKLLGLYIDGQWMSCGYEMFNVTHWMPAPTAPGESLPAKPTVSEHDEPQGWIARRPETAEDIERKARP
jgi:hypothetical protein